MVEIIFTGDIAFAGKSIKKNFFRDNYKDLLEFLENTDLVVSNLELPFCADKSLLTRKKFFNSLDNIDLLKIYNINLVSLANNHIDDCGIQGITFTKNILEGLGIKHLGVGQNITEAITPLILSKNGIKFGFISGCKEGFFNATNNKSGSSIIDEDIIKYLIYDLKKKELCNFVILLFHWGVEFSPFPHPDDRYLAHRLIDYGADLILGTHPHILQGYEKYKSGFIFYSLGNFITDIHLDTKPSKKILKLAKYSIMLKITFNKTNFEYETIPIYINEYGFPELLTKDKDLSNFQEFSTKINAGLNDERNFFRESIRNLWFREFKAWAINFIKHPIKSSILLKKSLNKRKALMIIKFFKLLFVKKL